MLSKRTVSRSVAAAAFLVALAGGSAPGTAQESDFDIRLGLGAAVAPRYEGSDRFTLRPLPVIDVSWRDRLFLNSSDGLGFYAINQGPFRLGAGVKPDLGRDESDDRRNLRGLGDIGMAARARVFASYRFEGAVLSTGISRDFGGGDGILVDVGIARPISLTERLTLTPSGSATWADGRHMSSYFGVSSGQARRSGLSRHSAGAGFKDIGVGLDARYALTESWGVGLRLRANYLLGDAADSPVTRRRFQPLSALTVTYRF